MGAVMECEKTNKMWMEFTVDPSKLILLPRGDLEKCMVQVPPPCRPPCVEYLLHVWHMC